MAEVLWILGSIDAIRIQNLIQVQAAWRKMSYSPVIVPSLQECHPAFVTNQPSLTVGMWYHK